LWTACIGQNLVKYLKILLRLLLLLFAENPDIFAVVHSQLKVVAVEYGCKGQLTKCKTNDTDVVLSVDEKWEGLLSKPFYKYNA